MPKKPQRLRKTKKFIVSRNSTAAEDYVADEQLARLTDASLNKCVARLFTKLYFGDTLRGVSIVGWTVSDKGDYAIATVRGRQKQKPVIAFVRGVDMPDAFVNLVNALEHNFIHWREDKWAYRNGSS